MKLIQSIKEDMASKLERDFESTAFRNKSPPLKTYLALWQLR